jgi:hypothetical protein
LAARFCGIKGVEGRPGAETPGRVKAEECPPYGGKTGGTTEVDAFVQLLDEGFFSDNKPV